jgi:hypothetical protein
VRDFPFRNVQGPLYTPTTTPTKDVISSPPGPRGFPSEPSKQTIERRALAESAQRVAFGYTSMAKLNTTDNWLRQHGVRLKRQSGGAQIVTKSEE